MNFLAKFELWTVQKLHFGKCKNSQFIAKTNNLKQTLQYTQILQGHEFRKFGFNKIKRDGQKNINAKYIFSKK